MTGRIYSLSEVRAAYPTVPTAPEMTPEINSNFATDPIFGAKDLLDRHNASPRMREMFTNTPSDTDDWSNISWTLTLCCFEHGMTADETYTVMSKAACNKYARDNRPDSHLKKEIDRAARHHEKEAAMANNKRGTSQPSSWEPVDLADYLDGSYEPAEPALLTRTDGVNLLYPSAMHSIYGEPESGKSWVALLAAKEVLIDGGRTLFFDFESDPGRIIKRLVVLGVPPSVIRERFIYLRPEEKIDAARLESLVALGCALVIIDGQIQCETTIGDYEDREKGSARWFAEFPKRFSRAGASVVMVDHVTKSNNGSSRFAIGSMYKLGAIDGASFTIEPTSPFGIGLKGEAEIRITKDRNGSLRQRGGKYRYSDRTQEIARLVIDATDPEQVDGSLLPVSANTSIEEPSAATHLMEQCSKYIEEHESATQTEIEKATSGDDKLIRQAIADLISRSYVKMKQVGNSKRHTSVKPYREPTSKSLRVISGGRR